MKVGILACQIKVFPTIRDVSVVVSGSHMI